MKTPYDSKTGWALTRCNLALIEPREITDIVGGAWGLRKRMLGVLQLQPAQLTMPKSPLCGVEVRGSCREIVAVAGCFGSGGLAYGHWVCGSKGVFRVSLLFMAFA